MEKTPSNRMATPATRTTSTPQGVIRTPPPLPQAAEVVDVPQPPIPGIRCPSCGRAMVPRRVGADAHKVYVACTLCPARMVLTYNGDRPATVRLTNGAGDPPASPSPVI